RAACSSTSGSRRVKALFVLNHPGYFGVFQALVAELARRGHAVHVGFLSGTREDFDLMEQAAAEVGVTYGRAPKRGTIDGWGSVAFLARALGDLGRYSDPRFSESPALRDRMAAKVESHLTGAAGFDPLTRRVALRRARTLHSRNARSTPARGSSGASRPARGSRPSCGSRAPTSSSSPR